MTEKFKPYLNGPQRVEREYLSKGPFSFSKHLGKPLGDDLWDDIIYNLKPKEMLLYRVGAERTPLTTPDSLTIVVDESSEGFIVKDMIYQGWYS